MRLVQEKKPKANKDHECDSCLYASEFIQSNGLPEKITFFEKRQLIIARRKSMKIKKGNIYLNQSVEYEGALHTFKAMPEIHAICLKYDFYPTL